MIDAVLGAVVMVPQSQPLCFSGNSYEYGRYNTPDELTMELHPLLNHRKNEYRQNFRDKNQETISRAHFTATPLSQSFRHSLGEELSYVPSCSQQKHPERGRAMNKSYMSWPLLLALH